MNFFFFFSQARSRLNPQQTDQLRSDINSTLHDLEQSQQNTRISRSLSPIRHSYRSSSVDEQRNYRLNSKFSFEDNPLIER